MLFKAVSCMYVKQLIVPKLLVSPGVIPRNTHALFGLNGIPRFRTFNFSSEISAPESTKKEHSWFETLIDKMTKFDAATLIEYIDPLFLKNSDSVFDCLHVAAVAEGSCSRSDGLDFELEVVASMLGLVLVRHFARQHNILHAIVALEVGDHGSHCDHDGYRYAVDCQSVVHNGNVDYTHGGHGV